MKTRHLVCLAIASSFSASAIAGIYSDTMGKCLVSSSSDADKAMLVRWMFSSVTLHPAVASLSAITSDQRADINKQAGELFDRLLTSSCRKETGEALKYEGAMAMQSSFQIFGQVAAASMMSHPAVSAGFADVTKYLDEKKIMELANGK